MDGDLLLVRTNGNPHYIGRSAVFVPPDARRWLYASYLIRVRLDHRLKSRYIDDYLKTERGRRELLRRVTTSAGNHNINTKSIQNLPVPVPLDASDQDKLIQLTDTAEQFIRSLRHELSQQERLKRGLLQVLLTGKVRVKVSP
jgi:type I restriction enzyme S subunit